MEPRSQSASNVPRFDRGFLASASPFARIGEGEVGGKGSGLLGAHRTLVDAFDHGTYAQLEVRVPRTILLTSSLFDAFLARNGLGGLADSEASDAEIAHAFQRGSLPTEVVGDLRGLVEEVRSPLAVRSSSLLEDAALRPFAGIYLTKMTPNGQPDPADRFRRLVEAIKLVFASTFFRAARNYARVAGHTVADEKMAVLVQEVVGSRRWDRFYPTVSGVARSFNYYATEGTKPEDGVVSLALGLGRTIVDGGACWTYSPVHPRKPAPYGSVRDLLKQSQNRFWAVRMGRAPAYDPINETEHMIEAGLEDAELDGTLERIASTYDPAADRLTPGTAASGPRVIDFAPLLRRPTEPFNDAILHLLQVCRASSGTDVELEFAVDWHRERDRALLGLLQVRPVVVTGGEESLDPAELEGPEVLLSSRSAVGNGSVDEIRDVVYLRPDTFDPGKTHGMATEVGSLNAELVQEGRPYILIGFGRWGTTDPWRGVPTRWDQVGGARVIVEASLPDFRAASSQGSHFFHNVTSLRVLYLALSPEETGQVDWSWLGTLPVVRETSHVRRVRADRALSVRVDGRTRMGGIWKMQRPPGQRPPSTGASR